MFYFEFLVAGFALWNPILAFSFEGKSVAEPQIKISSIIREFLHRVA